MAFFLSTIIYSFSNLARLREWGDKFWRISVLEASLYSFKVTLTLNPLWWPACRTAPGSGCLRVRVWVHEFQHHIWWGLDYSSWSRAMRCSWNLVLGQPVFLDTNYIGGVLLMSTALDTEILEVCMFVALWNWAYGSRADIMSWKKQALWGFFSHVFILPKFKYLEEAVAKLSQSPLSTWFELPDPKITAMQKRQEGAQSGAAKLLHHPLPFFEVFFEFFCFMILYSPNPIGHRVSGHVIAFFFL